MLYLEGIYLVKNNHSIINGKVGRVYYSTDYCRFVFVLTEADDLEDIGEYLVNPSSLTKVSDAEQVLMQETRIYIERPEGI